MTRRPSLTRRRLLAYGGSGLAAAIALSTITGAESGSRAPDRRPVYADRDLEPRLGDLHAHTAYSDGAAGTRPADAYAAGREAGWDFMAVSEHSEWLPLPVEADESCLDPTSERLPVDCTSSSRT